MTVIKHVSVGSTLTQAEWEADETHTVDGSTDYTFLTSTGGTMTGGLTLEGGLIAWIGGSLDDGYYSGMGEKGTAGAALAVGDLCYFSTADSRWELADASTEATCKQKLGICVLAAAGDGSTTALLRWGNVRADAAFPTLTVGYPVFVSITAGDITSTGSPTATGEIMRRVGTANTANELALEISNDYYTVTT